MTTITDVRREITVGGTPERAFDLFTNHMAEWWPAEHHLAGSPVVAMTCRHDGLLTKRPGSWIRDVGPLAPTYP